MCMQRIKRVHYAALSRRHLQRTIFHSSLHVITPPKVQHLREFAVVTSDLFKPNMRIKIRLLLVLTALFFLHDASANPLEDFKKSINYSCGVNADCVVKDVGNCCGYFPQCVNVNAEVSRDVVRKACKEGQLVSSCGFAEVRSCACVQTKCTPAGSSIK